MTKTQGEKPVTAEATLAAMELHIEELDTMLCLLCFARKTTHGRSERTVYGNDVDDLAIIVTRRARKLTRKIQNLKAQFDIGQSMAKYYEERAREASA